MKESNYWQQFLNTGSIEDYLKFKENQDIKGGLQKRITMGEDPYAGIDNTNRNSIKCDAYRGIR